MYQILSKFSISRGQIWGRFCFLAEGANVSQQQSKQTLGTKRANYLLSWWLPLIQHKILTSAGIIPAVIRGLAPYLPPAFSVVSGKLFLSPLPAIVVSKGCPPVARFEGRGHELPENGEPSFGTRAWVVRSQDICARSLQDYNIKHTQACPSQAHSSTSWWND